MPLYPALRVPVFEPAPGAKLPVTCQVARFPSRWRRIITAEYQTRTGRDSGWLPTRSLADLLDPLDVNIIHVSSDLDGPWIYAHAPVSHQVITVAVAAWAAAQIPGGRPDSQWLEMLGDDPVPWEEATFDLLACGTWPNGTASMAPHSFRLLPGHLAARVTSAGLTLLGHHRSFLLGPVDSSGRRCAVCWPAERADDDEAGPGLWTPKIEFHIETIPGYPRPRIHADLTMTRFPLQPVTYVPGRGSRPGRVSLWLHARDGFLRAAEQPALLGATAGRRLVDGQYRWAWDPGLAWALARLAYHPFPDPAAVLADPAAHAAAPVSAYVVYSGGTTLAAPRTDDSNGDGDDEGNGGNPRPKSVLHAAQTGFQPVDHLDLYQQLQPLLEPLGLIGAPDLQPAETTTTVPPLLKPRDDPRQRYTLEVWTQSPATRQAVLDTITRQMGFTPEPAAARSEPAADGAAATMTFTGPFSLTVLLRDAGTVAAGITRPSPGDKLAKRGEAKDQRLREIAAAAPRCADRRAVIVEIAKPGYFERIKKDDPYPALKKGFALTNRRVQCVHPIYPYTPKPGARKPKKTLPGTPFTTGDIERAAATVQDALRQLGRIGALPPPPGLTAGCELIGIWLEHADQADIPIVIRISTDGTATAQIATGPGSQEMPYADLPLALAEGHGRLRRDKGTDWKARIASFLTQALGIGDVTHDRAVFVRAASFRTRGWPWIQDKNITPGQLVLPGNDPAGENTERLAPASCPGLRIIRTRERGSQQQVPHAFGSRPNGDYGRVTGLFKISDLVCYGMNPRSPQARTPKTLTKLNPAQASNVRWQGWNPNPLEITPAFLQDGDHPADWAAYTQALRRAYLHTTLATQHPLPLHLAGLAKEYLT